MFTPVNPKQSFPTLEAEMLAFWKVNDAFKKSLEIRKDAEEFAFYDGPPFATGTPHYGHLLAGTIKDIIPRYQTMKGKYVERRFGWDCHGLPIENIVEKKLGISGKKQIEDEIGVFQFNEECRKNVFGYVSDWQRVVERMGRWVDMDNDYKTLDTDFMESVWWVFKSLYEKGLIYESNRVVPYCTRCSTPLSNFEVNQGYEDKQDKAVTVKFAVKGNANKYILAWTTTPWTLPANLGLAVGKDIEYAEIRDTASGETYVLASERIKSYYKNEADYTLVRTYPGGCLVGIEYEPVFNDFELQSDDLPKGMSLGEHSYQVVLGHHVTTDSGTGIVHIAPAYGEDDSAIGQKEGLGYVAHIDAVGKTCNLLSNNETYVFDFNEVVIRDLKDRKAVVHIGTIDHSYPHCYRCHTPLIYRGISAWYVSVEKIKEKMLAANAQTAWVPENIRDGRFGKWLEGARDWNISRNRYWGSAMPIWKSEEGDVELCVGSVKELYELNRDFGDIIEKDGTYFYAKTNAPVDIHKHFVDEIRLKDPVTGKTLRRIPEVLDCWFESGSMPYAQKHYPFENRERFEASFPADFICEGLDQTRGWFYTLVVLAAGLFDQPPFKHVIVNGIILAEDGKKMSKSLKNYPDPELLIDKHGADAIRFYILNSPAVKAEDLRFSEAGVEETVKKVILPLWNTYSFFTTYANIDGWEKDRTEVTFVRHGQTDTNLQGRISDGGDNAPLNETGRSQARATGVSLKAKRAEYDVILVSPLDRAQETARIIAEEIGHQGDFQVVPELIERHAGRFSGLPHTSISDHHEKETGEKITHTRYYDIAEMYDGEKKEELQERVEAAYDEIVRQFAGKRILIVAHGGTFRALRTYLYGLSFDDGYRAPGIGNAEAVSLPIRPVTNLLDKWILSRLEKLIGEVTNALDSYDLQTGTRSIVEFMDELTNWYVRRSRRRFWRSENDGDKLSAYETLYEVLTTVSRVLAPFCPFVSDAVYRGLVGGGSTVAALGAGSSPEANFALSVHLADFPEFSRMRYFAPVVESMRKTRSFVELGLALRSRKKIRVRQPLASITIESDLEPYYLDILREELNVKEVIVQNMSDVALAICKPNAKLIGPRFGKAVQEIIQAAKSGNFTLDSHGRATVGEYVLEAGEFEIAYQPKEGVHADIEAGFGTVIAMDTEITRELELEGFARDIVRIIQDMRKDAGYSVNDRITLSISGADEVVSAFGTYIASETLAEFGLPEKPDATSTVEIDGLGSISVAMAR